MPVVFSDPTAKWVPFATAAVIVAVTWGGMVWEDFEVQTASVLALWFAVVLFVAIFFQGWLYWTDQIATLRFDGTTAEATTMRWVGWGKRHELTAAETSDWIARGKGGDATKLVSIGFKARNKTLSLSFLDPRIADFDALNRLNPEFFAEVRANYPTVGGGAAASG